MRGVNGVQPQSLGRIPVGMRPGRREVGSASVDISVPKQLPEHMRDGTREVSSLYVEPAARRQRLATVLMNLICQEADANQITLVLTAKPFEDGEDPMVLGPADVPAPRMTAEQLIAWYQLFGFVEVQTLPEGVFMARRVTEKPRVKPVTLAVARALPKILH